ncbi:RNA polymerase subunit sigma [Rhodoblastus sphagnicola]|uniref:RNA polymerase sigma factor n=1 Tax=Rhodoblastus sphagnicola TaxID=333368 RepID=A0A2S6N3S7_9HYPH|nr:sigma-70 family RNA polymerase sigma factor [Rhodoblastus sphagnicola]MBB4198925.1 RNA polymerase sigma-70 factor (ECF subfamily) [Rhodoblastus sphagnicola]PPQ29270.1 RNA polymerase subunit sigma [Rhodoblastus sphagnicola]
MTPTAEFKTALLAQVAQLRFFALSLTNMPDRADDLVQETLIKAWAASNRFQEGTSIRAWLFTIMRNTFYSDYRKARREVQDTDGEEAAKLMSYPEQGGCLDLQDLKIALAQLSEDHREAILLVGASGVSYEEAAAICDCAVGTIKSRVNRARQKLMELMGIDAPEEIGGEFLAAGDPLRVAMAQTG